MEPDTTNATINIKEVNMNEPVYLSEGVLSTLKSREGLIEASEDNTRALIVVTEPETYIREDGGFGKREKVLKGIVADLEATGYPNQFTDIWSFVWEYANKEVWNLVSRSLEPDDRLKFVAEFTNGVEITRLEVYRFIGKRGRGADGSKEEKQVGNYILSATVFSNNSINNEEEEDEV